MHLMGITAFLVILGIFALIATVTGMYPGSEDIAALLPPRVRSQDALSTLLLAAAGLMLFVAMLGEFLFRRNRKLRQGTDHVRDAAAVLAQSQATLQHTIARQEEDSIADQLGLISGGYQVLSDRLLELEQMLPQREREVLGQLRHISGEYRDLFARCTQLRPLGETARTQLSGIRSQQAELSQRLESLSDDAAVAEAEGKLAMLAIRVQIAEALETRTVTLVKHAEGLAARVQELAEKDCAGDCDRAREVLTQLEEEELESISYDADDNPLEDSIEMLEEKLKELTRQVKGLEELAPEARLLKEKADNLDTRVEALTGEDGPQAHINEAWEMLDGLEKQLEDLDRDNDGNTLSDSLESLEEKREELEEHLAALEEVKETLQQFKTE